MQEEEQPRAFKKPRGRPPKLSHEIIEKIVTAIRTGAYIETAAAYAGIHKATFYRWLKKGAEAKRGLHKELSDAIEKALADVELADLQCVMKHAQGFETKKKVSYKKGDRVIEEREETTVRREWQAAAWRLERRFPERWGRRQRTELTGPDGEPLAPMVNQTQVFMRLPENGRRDPEPSVNEQVLLERRQFELKDESDGNGDGDGDGRKR